VKILKVYDKIFDWYVSARNPEAGVEVIRKFTQNVQQRAKILDIGCGGRHMRLLAMIMMLSILCLSGQTAHATDFYLSSAGGADAVSCGGFSSPCATFNYALDLMQPTDTLYVMPGTYDLDDETGPDNYVSIDKDDITIAAYDLGDKPLIYGVTSTQQDWMFRIIQADRVTIDGLRMWHNRNQQKLGYWQMNIEIADSEFVTIRNCEIAYSFSGIQMYGPTNRGHQILHNVIHTHGTSNTSPETGNGHGIAIASNSPKTSTTGWSDKIYIAHNDVYNCGGDSFQSNGHTNDTDFHEFVEIYDNTFHDNDEDGIDVKRSSNFRIHGNRLYDNNANGFVTSVGVSQNFEIYNNVIYGNGWGGLYIDGGNPNFKIYNNIVYNNAECKNEDCPNYGGAGAPWDRYQAYGIFCSPSSCEVYHNVIYGNGNGPQTKKDKAGFRGDATFVNNIVLENGDQPHDPSYEGGNIRTGCGGYISHNYVFPTTYGITGNHAITDANHGIFNPAAFVFTLQPGSLLIDTGSDLAGVVDADILSNPRPQDGDTSGTSEYDIGA
jgi:parallel beta-helix repeat protein